MLRPRLTYANVVATLALFIALGGASYAALEIPGNSVGTKQLKKNAVTTAKVKKEAITAAKVKKGTLTGTQIDTSTLGTVPGAVTAQTARTAQSAQSAQTAQSAQMANTIASPEPWHMVGTPGEPQFMSECKNDEEFFVPLPPVGFYKDLEGVVHLQGVYACPAPGAAAFRLPVGFRPGSFQWFAEPGGGEGEFIEVFASQSPPEDPGLEGIVGCAAEVCILNGITFRAES